MTNAPVSGSSYNRINHNGEKSNPEQITVKEMLKDVVDSDGNVYYQSVNSETSNTFSQEKYLNEKQTAIKNFYDIHRNYAEEEPEQYQGKRTIKTVLSYLGSKDNKIASINTPVEKVTITRNDVNHLLKENEKECSNFINRFIITLQNPNLVIESNENGKRYNYYIKSFIDKDSKISGHVQIVKKCTDGNFYVTNHHLKNSKFQKILKNGQIIYDLSDLSAMQNASDVNSITHNQSDFKVNNSIINTDGSVIKDILNPFDYDYINNTVTGEKIKIQMNEDIAVNEIQPQEISSELPFEASKKTGENKKKIKQLHNLDKGKIVNLINKATNESIEFKGTTIDESISKISVNDKNYNDYCLILCNTKSLFETSQKILSHNDTKKVSNLKYSRYANIAKIKSNEYLLEFVTKGKDKLVLYSITPIKNDTVKRVDKTSQHDTANNSITNIRNIFKSKLVEKYNNDYKSSLKNHSKKFNQEEPIQNNMFYDNVTPHNLQKVKGSFVPAENLIELFKNADESTIVHEFAHWWLSRLENFIIPYISIKKLIM